MVATTEICASFSRAARIVVIQDSMMPVHIPLVVDTLERRALMLLKSGRHGHNFASRCVCEELTK